MAASAKKRVALIGAKGMLAGMVRQVAPAHAEIFPFDLPDFDLTERERVMAVMAELRPQLIVNCAAYTDVDGCETNQDLAAAVNGHGPGNLAAAADRVGATLIHVSTDYVFDGRKKTPYAEDDQPDPQSAYGRSKLLGERTILESGLKRYFIVRTSWLYGPGGKNFVETILRLARQRDELRVVADQIGSPTFTRDLAQALFNLAALEDACRSGTVVPYGIYHFADEGHCSWHGFSQEIVTRYRRLGGELQVQKIHPIRTEEYPLPAPRPAYSVLDKGKYKKATGAIIPEWRKSLQEYLDLRGI